MNKLTLICIGILSFAQIKPDVMYDWDFPNSEQRKEAVAQKDIITPNEQVLSQAVMLTIIQLSDRQAVYAKQAILLQKDVQKAQTEEQKKCVQDAANFFKSLSLACNESEIRALHRSFADRFIECQRNIYLQENA